MQSLLSPEGIRWWLRNAIKNFTGFAPLGMVIIAMFGLGVASTFRIYRCVHPSGSGKPEREKKSYPVGDCPRIAVERHWGRRLYYSASHCRHAVSVGGTSSDSGDCDGLRFRGLRI